MIVYKKCLYSIKLVLIQVHVYEAYSIALVGVCAMGPNSYLYGGPLTL